MFTSYRSVPFDITVIELTGTPAMKSDVFPRLIRYVSPSDTNILIDTDHSRDPSVAFTAGQWMTEVSFYF